MYSDYNYPLGRDTIYYWIIDKKANTFSRPMNHDDFLKEISKYDDKQIPNRRDFDLKVKNGKESEKL